MDCRFIHDWKRLKASCFSRATKCSGAPFIAVLPRWVGSTNSPLLSPEIDLVLRLNHSRIARQRQLGLVVLIKRLY